ncbi:hypothetical protein JRQ81_016849, partial [Phrynocephalus forsythii]
FQKKENRNAGNEKPPCAVRKTGRMYGDRTTYATIKLDIPPGQEELILLQEQGKICQLRDSVIEERPEEESTFVSDGEQRKKQFEC